MRQAKKILTVIFLFVVSWIGYTNLSYDNNVAAQTNREVELSNTALKRQFDIGLPNFSQIKKLLAAHDFGAIEKLYKEFFNRYEKDVQYEWFLQEAYNVFNPNNDVSIEDLDIWIAKTGSYIAYAARGRYKSHQGFIARGGKYISETPNDKIDEMQRLHNEAAKDLQIAISKNPSLMPAYAYLVGIAKASNMTFTPKQILDKAEKNDKRTFFVRYEYMVSLQPRWGGSYEEMSAFAQYAIQYSNLNPRLWSLQGEADADRADNYYHEGNYAAAIKSYTAALKFGDRVVWLKSRAASYYKLGQQDESIADYKRVLYYSPTDSTAREFSEPDNALSLKYKLTENTSVHPKISKFKVKSYAVLSVEHQVSWLNTRSDKGRVVVYNNIAKIERMLKRLGYDCLERSAVVSILADQKQSLINVTDEKAQQMGKMIKTDAVIIATIPSMGLNHPQSTYYEDINIKAISVATGEIIWNSQLKGSVIAEKDKYDYTLILDSIESKLYDLLQMKLKSGLPHFKEKTD